MIWKQVETNARSWKTFWWRFFVKFKKQILPLLYKNRSSTQLLFYGNWSSNYAPTQFEKRGCGLLMEAFWSEGEWLLVESAGKNKSIFALKSGNTPFGCNVTCTAQIASHPNPASNATWTSAQEKSHTSCYVFIQHSTVELFQQYNCFTSVQRIENNKSPIERHITSLTAGPEKIT